VLLRIHQQVDVLRGGRLIGKAHPTCALKGEQGVRAYGKKMLADTGFVQLVEDLHDDLRRAAYAVRTVEFLVQLQGLAKARHALTRQFLARHKLVVHRLGVGIAWAE